MALQIAENSSRSTICYYCCHVTGTGSVVGWMVQKKGDSGGVESVSGCWCKGETPVLHALCRLCAYTNQELLESFVAVGSA